MTVNLCYELLANFLSISDITESRTGLQPKHLYYCLCVMDISTYALTIFLIKAII